MARLDWKIKLAKFDEYDQNTLKTIFFTLKDSYYSIKFHFQKTTRENHMKMDSVHMEMRVGSFIFRHELDETYIQGQRTEK